MSQEDLGYTIDCPACEESFEAPRMAKRSVHSEPEEVIPTAEAEKSQAIIEPDKSEKATSLAESPHGQNGMNTSLFVEEKKGVSDNASPISDSRTGESEPVTDADSLDPKQKKTRLFAWPNLALAFFFVFIVPIIFKQIQKAQNSPPSPEGAYAVADFFSEVNERNADLKKDMAEQLESKGVYEVDMAKAGRAMDAVKGKIQKLDGKGKEVGEAIFSVNDQILVLAKRHEAAVEKYVESGGTDASTIRTLEQLEAREKVIKELGESNDALLNFIQSIDVHLDAALANKELTPHQRTEAIQGYKKGANLEVVLAIRELDQQSVNDSLDVVSLLRKEWGRWRVQGDSVLFDRGSAVIEFNSILERIAVAGEKQSELQRLIAH